MILQLSAYKTHENNAWAKYVKKRKQDVYKIHSKKRYQITIWLTIYFKLIYISAKFKNVSEDKLDRQNETFYGKNIFLDIKVARDSSLYIKIVLKY